MCECGRTNSSANHDQSRELSRILLSKIPRAEAAHRDSCRDRFAECRHETLCSLVATRPSPSSSIGGSVHQRVFPALRHHHDRFELRCGCCGLPYRSQMRFAVTPSSAALARAVQKKYDRPLLVRRPIFRNEDLVSVFDALRVMLRSRNPVSCFFACAGTLMSSTITLVKPITLLKTTPLLPSRLKL